jgi:glucose-1-phosphate thymidylyltransferase
MNIVGLIPAGGLAKRIDPLPCSKELLPVGFQYTDDGTVLSPKTVCHYLLEKMHLAGVTKIFIILRKGKWDIPEYFGDGSTLKIDIAYLIMNLPFGVPFTLDQAYAFVEESLVVFGFPDIIFEPDDAFTQLIEKQKSTAADVVLGVFPAHQPDKMDMVDFDDEGRIHQIVIKPSQTHLQFTWIIAVWTPKFTDFLHKYLLAAEKTYEHSTMQGTNDESGELYIGNVIQAALDKKLKVETVKFSKGTYIDIGTPNDLVKASHKYSNIT